MPKIIEDEKVFQAVIETIVERGYAGATTRQMAEAAGISEVTLFRKYDSKLHLVQRAVAAIIDQADFESAAKYSGDIQSDLLRVLHAYQGSAVMHSKFVTVLFSEIVRNPELADTFDLPLSLFRSIGQLLARYQAAGVLQPEHPLQAVAALLGPVMYFAMITSAIPEEHLPPFDIHRHISHFLEGRHSRST